MVKASLAKNTSSSNTTLVMLSGGIDSTAALWHVLNNAEEYGKIHVHHIHIQNIEKRWEVEAMAVKAIYEYLHKHVSVEFTTSESAINTPSFNRDFLYDVEVIGFMSGYMTSRDKTITKLVLGATGYDWGRETASDVSARSRATHNAFHPEMKDHSSSIKEFPNRELTKQQVYDTLPPDLAILTWSCRRPRFIEGKFVECGMCKTCREELRDLVRVEPVLEERGVTNVIR